MLAVRLRQTKHLTPPKPHQRQRIIDKAIAKDPARHGAEYLSQWRDDLATFLSRDLLDTAVEPGVTVRPPIEGVTYCAATDSSDGVSDSFTMSIAHKELHNGSKRVVVDYLFERRPPFHPGEVIAEIAGVLRQYRCSTVTGDRYAAGFVIEAFRNNQIEYRYSRFDRSEAYLGFLLLDHPRGIAQFAGLVRRTFPSGKDRVDHEIGGHDDCSNSIALAAVLASAEEQVIPIVAPLVFGTPRNIPGSSTTGNSERTPDNSGQSSTSLYYEWMNRGGGMP